MMKMMNYKTTQRFNRSFLKILTRYSIFKSWCQGDRVTGRKARGLQTEDIGCKRQAFFLSLLSIRKKQSTSVRFFSLLYTKLKVFSYNSVLPWWHLIPPELNFSQILANQSIFLMEMFFLSYANELCFYPRLSFFKSIRSA